MPDAGFFVRLFCPSEYNFPLYHSPPFLIVAVHCTLYTAHYTLKRKERAFLVPKVLSWIPRSYFLF